MPFSSHYIFSLLFLLPIFLKSLSQTPNLHLIKFKSPSLYPEGLTYDRSFHRFIVAPLTGNTFLSVTDAGDTQTLTLTSSQIAANSTTLGLAIDHRHNRLLAAVNSLSTPHLASFILHRSSLDLEFLSPLTPPSTGIANGVDVDPHGNAYVTNSEENVIYKVTKDGVVSLLSNSSLFTHFAVNPSPYSYCGLNGVVYTNDYLLVVQSNTGKMFKVNAVNGTSSTVILLEDLPLADGMSVRDDGVVVVVSMNSAWFLKSDDEWAHGVVIDKIALDREGDATSVTVDGDGRVFVVYGYVQEAINGISQEREWFRIEEIRYKREKESEEESGLWIFILVGLGLVYFIVWKFQMGQLVKNMDRKRA